MAQQKTTIKIPSDYTPAEREDFGTLVADFIRERTAKGIGVKERGGRFVRYNFPKYSESYVGSLDFKIAGKSKSKVNLELSGEMLGDLAVLRHKRGEVVVGFEAGSESNDKAEGNQLGSYGGEPNPRKARSFLGVTNAELTALVREFERHRE